MTYSTTWFMEKRAVLITLSGNITLDDMIAYSAILHDEFLEKGIAPVHLVFDLNEASGFPTQVMAIKRASDAYMHHPSLGWAVFVGINNPLLGFLANTVAQTLRIKTQKAKTLEEARTLLQRIDTTLEGANS